MAVTVAVETGFWIIGAVFFPFGLALAILLGTEIITGSYALIPCVAVESQGVVVVTVRAALLDRHIRSQPLELLSLREGAV